MVENQSCTRREKGDTVERRGIRNDGQRSE